MVREGISMVVSGSDWLEKDLLKQWGVTLDWLNKAGISVCFFPFYETQFISSTIIKERVRSV